MPQGFEVRFSKSSVKFMAYHIQEFRLREKLFIPVQFLNVFGRCSFRSSSVRVSLFSLNISIFAKSFVSFSLLIFYHLIYIVSKNAKDNKKTSIFLKKVLLRARNRHRTPAYRGVYSGQKDFSTGVFRFRWPVF